MEKNFLVNAEKAVEDLKGVLEALTLKVGGVDRNDSVMGKGGDGNMDEALLVNEKVCEEDVKEIWKGKGTLVFKKPQVVIEKRGKSIGEKDGKGGVSRSCYEKISVLMHMKELQELLGFVKELDVELADVELGLRKVELRLFRQRVVALKVEMGGMGEKRCKMEDDFLGTQGETLLRERDVLNARKEEIKCALKKEYAWLKARGIGCHGKMQW